MAKHARYSPSKLADVEACSCWTDAPQQEIDVDQNEAAAEGTMLHHACETGDMSHIETDEQQGAVDSARAYVNSVIAEIPRTPEIRREVLLVLKDITFGTADVLVIDRIRKELHVFDYKFVRTSVTHAEDNLQTQAYGAAALERFPSCVRVHTHIVAPRIGDFTRACFGRELLTDVRNRIYKIIAAAADPFKKPCAGEQCRFCGVKDRCPALAETAVAVVRGAGMLPMPTEFLPERIVSPTDRAKAMLLARILPDWADAVRAMNVAAVLEYGEEIPGFSLRRRAGTVSIKDPAAVLAAIVGTLGYSYEDLLISGTATVSLSKLADLMMERNPVKEFDTKRDYMNVLVERLGDAVSQGHEVIYLQKDRKPTDAELALQLCNREATN